MPIHDWSHVEAGIFHDFHHAWIEEIKRSLNTGLLPDDFYRKLTIVRLQQFRNVGAE